MDRIGIKQTSQAAANGSTEARSTMGALLEEGAPSVKFEKLPAQANNTQCSSSKGASLEIGWAALTGWGTSRKIVSASAGGKQSQQSCTSPAGG